MNNKFSSCILVKFAPQSTTPPELADFLDEYFEVTACNYADDGTEEYVGYADTSFSADDLISAAHAQNISLPPFTTEKLENKNWLTANVIKFAPFEAADFCIYGVHEPQAPATDKLPIKIYAATAFGSSHQTTRCCLQAISDLNALHAPHQKILDIGTGSGILSLACAKLWAQDNPQIVAGDIDIEAVNVTTQNAFDNNLEQFLQVTQSDGYQAELITQNAPYDIIMANILARPLIEMAPNLAENLKQGGYCILSGFVEDQTDWVVSAHQKEGLSLVKTYQIDNWRAVIMEKQA